jgi:predicted ATPase
VSSNVAQEGTQHNLKSQSNILLIEQPELHLHPRMQGKLLDLLLDVGKVSDGSIQIIAETHSEAFLLKLQSAIRSGRVDPKDVALVYVERVEGLGSKATELELTPDGDIAGKWPDLTNFAAVRFEQTK